MNTERMRMRIASLILWERLKNQGILKSIDGVLSGLEKGCESFVGAYCALVSHTLRKGGVKEALLEEILSDGNLFAKRSQILAFDEIERSLTEAAAHDVNILSSLIFEFSADSVLQEGAKRYESMKEEILSLPRFDMGKSFEISDVKGLYGFYKRNGYGFFAKNPVCIYQNKKIVGVKSPDPIRLSDLKGYERQKNIIIGNTRLFLSGREANNVLLYGDKGTGKSSTVKAVVNEFQEEGLRLIEIRKEDLSDFHTLCEILSESPFKFIVFLDDISFAKEDESFGTLKAVIEGGIVRRPDNVIIYATSNRRHLVNEKFSDREGDDIHIKDTIETITSLSDRFGIEVVFGAPDKDEYLKIVTELAAEQGIEMDAESLYLLAERFALLKSGRSPRTARQFVTSLLARE